MTNVSLNFFRDVLFNCLGADVVFDIELFSISRKATVREESRAKIGHGFPRHLKSASPQGRIDVIGRHLVL